MSGYTPLFRSLTGGSLYGKWPDIGLWPIVLSLSDKNGIVDVHHRMLAGITGLPEEEIRACMARFCEPDPDSRSEEANGARLELVDEHRDWGWRIVNHSHYREKARKAAYDAERTASGADAERKRKERESREVPTSPAKSRADPLSDSDTDSNTNSEKTRKPAARACALPPDFGLTETRKVYAEERLPNVDPPELMAAFRDYHSAKGTVAKDWDASWRTYVRNGLEFGYPMKVAAARIPEKQIRIDANGRQISG